MYQVGMYKRQAASGAAVDMTACFTVPAGVREQQHSGRTVLHQNSSLSFKSKEIDSDPQLSLLCLFFYSHFPKCQGILVASFCLSLQKQNTTETYFHLSSGLAKARMRKMLLILKKTFTIYEIMCIFNFRKHKLIQKQLQSRRSLLES